jgi:hypothetical protein
MIATVDGKRYCISFSYASCRLLNGGIPEHSRMAICRLYYLPESEATHGVPVETEGETVKAHRPHPILIGSGSAAPMPHENFRKPRVRHQALLEAVASAKLERNQRKQIWKSYWERCKF